MISWFTFTICFVSFKKMQHNFMNIVKDKTSFDVALVTLGEGFFD
jgi:hypothetical protein